MDLGTRLGIGSLIFGIGLSLFCFFAAFVWRRLGKYAARIGLFVGTVLMAMGVGLIFFLPADEKPEITLRFVTPQFPELVLDNKTRATDFITAHDHTMPMNVFSNFVATGGIKTGDEIWGTVGVMCPACSRGNTYWVYIKWGTGGWLSHIEKMTDGDIFYPKPSDAHAAGHAVISGISKNDKIYIQPSEDDFSVGP